MTSPGHPWWRHAVCYQVYIRSFADADGDGLGDMAGITQRIPALAELGVDAIWITPFYPSPQHDHGYDVADYTDVDPRFGSLDDFDTMCATAHQHDIRLIVDLVPNHTSSDHAWFAEALVAGPGAPARDRYLFRTGRGPDGDEPPNNWQSVFGGPAWTRACDLPGGDPEDREWYLHLFDRTQPDLDWRNPEVGDMFEGVLRFWLDRGVDGFRIDVAHGMFKEASLRDQVVPDGGLPTSDAQEMVARTVSDEPMWDQPEVHEVYRRWHRVLAEYPGDTMMVAEAWTSSTESMARFIRPDECQQSFNFHWLMAPWSAPDFARVIADTLTAVEPVGASPTWVLSNHDVVRHPTRYGGEAQGVARGRAATLTMLALPGSAYLYQGEELGLEQVDVADADKQDPRFLQTGEGGRDGCRVPIPWEGQEPPYGFGPGTAQPWIPQPEDWATLTWAVQHEDAGSTWSFYRDALAARRTWLGAEAEEQVHDLRVEGEVLRFRRGDIEVVLNCGTTEVALPTGEVLVSSRPVAEALPGETAVWLRV